MKKTTLRVLLALTFAGAAGFAAVRARERRRVLTAGAPTDPQSGWPEEQPTTASEGTTGGI